MRPYSIRQLGLACLVTAVVTTVGVLAVGNLRRGSEDPARWTGTKPALGRLPFPTPLDMADPRAQQMVRERYEQMVAHARTVLADEERQAVTALFSGARIPWSVWWLGIPVVKAPPDLVMMQQILTEIRPDFVIETGTFQGGSALYFAHVLEGLELVDARVITIDIEDMTKAAAQRALWRRRVEFIHGSSTDPTVVARVTDRVRGGRVAVFLDSSHARDHVLDELRAYAPLVSPGSYVVVEDMNLALPRLHGGPRAATETFLASEVGRSFRPDTAREAYLWTLNPGGWLRRTD